MEGKMKNLKVLFTGCHNAVERLEEVKKILQKVDSSAELQVNIDRGSKKSTLPLDVDLLIVDSCCWGAELEEGEINKFVDSGRLMVQLRWSSSRTEEEVLDGWEWEIRAAVKTIQRYRRQG